jgi:hypothetical protein
MRMGLAIREWTRAVDRIETAYAPDRHLKGGGTAEAVRDAAPADRVPAAPP